MQALRAHELRKSIYHVCRIPSKRHCYLAERIDQVSSFNEQLISKPGSRECSQPKELFIARSVSQIGVEIFLACDIRIILLDFMIFHDIR